MEEEEVGNSGRSDGGDDKRQEWLDRWEWW